MVRPADQERRHREAVCGSQLFRAGGRPHPGVHSGGAPALLGRQREPGKHGQGRSRQSRVSRRRTGWYGWLQQALGQRHCPFCPCLTPGWFGLGSVVLSVRAPQGRWRWFWESVSMGKVHLKESHLPFLRIGQPWEGQSAGSARP